MSRPGVFSRLTRRLVWTSLFIALAGCGYGTGWTYWDDYYYDCCYYYDQDASAPSFLAWSGSANGPWVLDANGDAVRFRSDARTLFFGNTTYLNLVVDGEGGLLYEGERIGSVALLPGEDGSLVAAMVLLERHWTLPSLVQPSKQARAPGSPSRTFSCDTRTWPG